jgi:hypothetical protein
LRFAWGGDRADPPHKRKTTGNQFSLELQGYSRPRTGGLNLMLLGPDPGLKILAALQPVPGLALRVLGDLLHRVLNSIQPDNVAEFEFGHALLLDL